MNLKTWRISFSDPDYDPEIISFDRFDFQTINPTDAEQKALAIKVAHEMTGLWGSAEELETPSADPTRTTPPNRKD